MSPQTAYIDLEQHFVRSRLGGIPAPPFVAILRDTWRLDVAFTEAGLPVALADGSTGKLKVKRIDHPAGSPLLMDLEWSATGEGAATRYRFTTVCDSEQLRDELGPDPEIVLCCQIEWIIADELHLSQPFELTVINAWSRDSDEAPDPAGDAAEAWLNARGVRFDRAQSLNGTQRNQALANLGMTVSADRITLPDGRYFFLNVPDE